MNDQDLDRLRALLLQNRKEILDRVRHLETDIETLQEVQPEMEEEAKKVESTSLYSRIDDQEREELDSIELALKKMEAGRYGKCEVCGESISLKRLQAIPWVRLCRQDAEEMEKNLRRLSPAKEIDISELP